MTDARVLLAGAVLGGVGVGLGAFGAHALRDALDAKHLEWWNTGVQYQMWHAVALVALAGVPGMRVPAMLLGAGVLLFSVALYVLALTDARWLGAVAPIGGALMIAGWIGVAWRALKDSGTGRS